MEGTNLGIIGDAVIIVVEQQVKQYKITISGTLHAYAKTLGKSKVTEMLALTLNKEKKTNAVLTGTAYSAIKKQAATGSVRH